ncbi:MAG: thioredoxin domain-containing protein, partial [Candidatus Woesearchaeota archaeon]
MEHETKKTSAKKLKQSFLAGFAVVGLLLLTLNFQIAGLSSEIGELNSVLTGAVPGGSGEEAQPDQGADQGAQPEPSGDVEMEQLVEGASYKGDSDAPVTIVEFSDFACPFCNKFYEDTLGQIEENYVETGDVKLIYRHFPVVGGEAQAEAAV